MLLKLRLNRSALLSAGVAALIMLTSCGPQVTQTSASKSGAPLVQPVVVGTSSLSGRTVTVDGSSSVYPLTKLVADEFAKGLAEKAPTVDVKFSGTTGGFKRFCAGETDISNASRPISVAEIATCGKAGVGFIELPVGFDALTIAVNSKNTWANDITMEELTKIWQASAQGKITNWNQVRNGYPNKPLKLFGAGADSGTFDYFNEVVTGNADGSRTDYTGSEDDNVLVEGIAKEEGALGYIPFSYYESAQEKLKALPVNSGKGAIAPSIAAVEKATYQPFSRPLLIYVNSKSAQTKPEVRAFVEYYLSNARNLAADAGFVPLPQEGYRLADIQFTRGEIGTVFDGKPQPDVTISELLRKQTVFVLSEEIRTEQTAK
jgi:phosphate transport system substrate-binding protein